MESNFHDSKTTKVYLYKINIFIKIIYRSGLFYNKIWLSMAFAAFLLYGLWTAVYKRFRRWQIKGIWEKIFEFSKKEVDTEYCMIDSTIIRSHACAAGYEKNGNDQNALGRSIGGFTTKIHAHSDRFGNPLKFILTAR